MEKQIKDINFDELQSVRKKCITFVSDGNTVVKPCKKLYSLEQITHNPKHKTLYIEVKTPKTEWEQPAYYLFNDLEKVCIKVSYVNCYMPLSEFIKAVNKYPYFGEDGFFKRLREAEENKLFVNKLDIEVCLIFGKEELAEHYAEYRENYLAAKKIEKQAREAEREEKRKEEERKNLEKVKKIVQEAENAIKTKKELWNTEFENTTIILYLLKKYEIKVPLKTQGWINKGLAKIWYKDKEITYSYYKTSRNSKVFWKYLKELEQKILSA